MKLKEFSNNLSELSEISESNTGMVFSNKYLDLAILKDDSLIMKYGVNAMLVYNKNRVEKYVDAMENFYKQEGDDDLADDVKNVTRDDMSGSGNWAVITETHFKMYNTWKAVFKAFLEEAEMKSPLINQIMNVSDNSVINVFESSRKPTATIKKLASLLNI